MGAKKIAFTVVVKDGWCVAVCQEGTDGYWPVLSYGPYAEEREARAVVTTLNEGLGLSGEDAWLIVASTMGVRPSLTDDRW